MKNIQDYWAKKAKKAGLRSRAAYKLEEINKKHNLFSGSQIIFELGSAPGGWSQIIARLKDKGSVCYSFDFLKMVDVKGIIFYNYNFFDDEFREFSKDFFSKTDLILSDMSVNLSGISIKDAEENKQLNYFCLELSKKLLTNRGKLLIKTFNNENLKDLKKEFLNNFQNVFIEKPQASKTSSSEVYLLGLNPK